MAAMACAVVTKHGLNQRLPHQVAVSQTIAPWEHDRHAAQATINWQLTTAKAQRTLQGLYPAYSTWCTTSVVASKVVGDV
jgi:hypothetical protein